MESSNVTESYIPPDNRMFGAIIAGALFEFAVFAALWLVFDSPKMAAALWLFLHMAVIFAAGGAYAMNKAQTNTIERLADAMTQRAPQVIDADWTVKTPQLPEPRADDWQRIDSNLMLRQDQIEATASKVYMKMYPHTQPTRENVQAMFPSLRSNGMITAVMGYLVERGVAEGGGQGSAYHWSVRE